MVTIDEILISRDDIIEVTEVLKYAQPDKEIFDFTTHLYLNQKNSMDRIIVFSNLLTIAIGEQVDLKVALEQVMQIWFNSPDETDGLLSILAYAHNKRFYAKT